MKKATKILALALALVLIIVIAIGATVAYLTATTTAKTNTFTIGDIKIHIDETAVDNYVVVPGGTSAKDPKIVVEGGSENCYVYAYVENNIAAAVASLDIDSSKWISVATSGNKTLYRYFEVVNKQDANKELPLFTTVTYKTDVTNASFTALDTKTIVINAFAHQAENVAQDVADAAAKTQFHLS